MKYPILKNWNKYVKVVRYICIFLISILFVIFWSNKKNQQIVLKIINKSSLSVLTGLNILLYVGVLLLFICVTIISYTIIHEAIHVLFIKEFWKKDIKIIISKKAVSVDSKSVETKARFLYGLISPFVLLQSILIILIITMSNNYTILIVKWLMIVNLISISDIISFFVVLIKVPRNSYIIDNVYYIDKDEINDIE